MLLSDTRCAVRRSGDGEPLTGLGILDRVALLDPGQRHLLCYMFRAHYPPGWSWWLPASGDHLEDSPVNGTGQSHTGITQHRQIIRVLGPLATRRRFEWIEVRFPWSRAVDRCTPARSGRARPAWVRSPSCR